MNIIPNYSPNFTSQWYIIGYNNPTYAQEKFYNSEKFKQQARELEKNDNSDIVVFCNDYMTVKNDKGISAGIIIRNPFDESQYNYVHGRSIADAYKKCLESIVESQNEKYSRKDISKDLYEHILN